MDEKSNQNITKYLGVILNEYLPFNEYINTLKQKPNGGSGILAKLRYYISTDTLKTIYYALFDSHRDLHVKFGARVTAKYLI